MSVETKIIGSIILLTILVLGGSVLLINKDGIATKEKLSKPLMGEKMPDQGAIHVKEGSTHIAYNSNPPTSGPHWAGVAGPGIKDEAVPDELVLHSMEHGAAVVWYKSDLDKEEVDKIKEAFNNSLGKKIMLPRKELDVPVALTSWGYLLKLNTVDTKIIKEFIETNNDRAPEKAAI
ncbi:MAG: DUF3105 domain-containing protein [Candidatus Pacebacteria bacterium]|nr:DUF3105 domain-containing protein [Candidatus Paceibacterota bacterium]